MARNATFEQIKAVIMALMGQANTITIPRELVRFFGGDYVAAGMMGQLIYWDDKTTTGDRWVYKTADQWDEELCISDYQVRRGAKVLTDLKFIKREFRKNPEYQNGTTPVWHYQLDLDTFIEMFTAFLEVRQTGTSTNSTTEVGETAPPPLKKLQPPLLTQPTTQPTTTTQQPKKPTKPATPRGASAPGGGGPLLNEKPTETEIYLRSIGCKSKTAIARHKDKPVEGVKAEYELLIAGGKRYDDPGAVLISILDAPEWVAPSPSSAAPLPDKPKVPYLLPEWQTWDTTTQQEEMQKYQIADRKWKAATGGRA